MRLQNSNQSVWLRAPTHLGKVLLTRLAHMYHGQIVHDPKLLSDEAIRMSLWWCSGSDQHRTMHPQIELGSFLCSMRVHTQTSWTRSSRSSVPAQCSHASSHTSRAVHSYACWCRNEMLMCDGKDCRVVAHQACYGVTSIPSGDWLCDGCKAGLDPNGSHCLLCPVPSGALRKVCPFLNACSNPHIGSLIFPPPPSSALYKVIL